MADFINVSLGASANASLGLAAYNNGREDPNLYFKVTNAAGFTVQPQETIRALIVPKSDGMTAAEASGLLADPNVAARAVLQRLQIQDIRLTDTTLTVGAAALGGLVVLTSFGLGLRGISTP